MARRSPPLPGQSAEASYAPNSGGNTDTVRPEPKGSGRFCRSGEELGYEKRQKEISLVQLAFLHGTYSFRYAASNKRWEDEKLNQNLGYLGRFIGLFFGVFGIPCVLMMYLIMDRMAEPWYTVWNCIILTYAYFAGVFITWRLHRYLHRESPE